MRLYFQNSVGVERVITEVENQDAAMPEIKKFLDNHNFKSYYMRIWTDKDGATWFDVGSHSEFFILREE